MSAGTRLFKVRFSVTQTSVRPVACVVIFAARAVQEFKEVSKLSKVDTGIELRPDENNIYAWKGFLQVQPRLLS